MSQQSTAQQTLGVFVNAPEAQQGYTMIAPTRYNEVYLINNCGELVHQWESTLTAGMKTQLTSDGMLLRAERSSTTFGSGGVGGTVLERAANSDLEWEIEYSNNEFCQHHDIVEMPNGNILLHAWYRKDVEQSLMAGRDPALMPPGGLWTERVVELKEVLPGQFEEVWSWDAWDHLVQDVDPLMDNFGEPSEHPELIDINYHNQSADFLHVNGLDYNEALDQIVISSRNYNEIWIIDHSTTTQQAATHTGGVQGRGGDILYRWGNPAAYGRGSVLDQTFSGQHDPEWIPETMVDGGAIKVFNNGINRGYSSVDILVPPVRPDGSYVLEAGEAFGPRELTWTFDDDGSFYSLNVSGAQRLPNGNTLICIGNGGELREVDYAGNLVWYYISPVGQTGLLAQGFEPTGNTMFQARKYVPDYPGLSNLSLESQGKLIPGDLDCSVYPEVAHMRFRAQLEGAFESSYGHMRTHLKAKKLIPQLQPYNGDPVFYFGGETAAHLPSNMVDWVLLEARDSSNPNIVLERIPCLLLRNGTIVSVSGDINLRFNTLTPGQAYYFAIRHRNHLPVMSMNPVTFGFGALVDFTEVNQVRDGGNQLISLGPEGFALKAGDFDSNGRINFADYQKYLTMSSAIDQYEWPDANLDGHVTVKDYDLYKKNQGSVAISELLY